MRAWIASSFLMVAVLYYDFACGACRSKKVVSILSISNFNLWLLKIKELHFSLHLGYYITYVSKYGPKIFCPDYWLNFHAIFHFFWRVALKFWVFKKTLAKVTVLKYLSPVSSMAPSHAQLGFENWVLDGPPCPKMVGFCDLLGTPYAPVSKIPSVKLNYLSWTQLEV